MENEFTNTFIHQNSDRQEIPNITLPLDSFKPQSVRLVQENRQSQKYLSSLGSSPCISQNEILQVYEQSRQSVQGKRNKQFLQTSIVPMVENQQLEKRGSNNITKIFYQKKLIRHFINQLKKSAYIYPNNSSLNQEKLQYFLQEQYLSENKKDLGEAEKLQKNQFPVLNPSSLSMLIWTIIKVIQLFLILAWAPFKICFEPDFSNSLSLESVILAIFFGDMIIKLNKGVIDQGMLIIERNKILKYYVRQELYYDFVNIVTTILLMQEQCCNQYFLLVCLVIVQYFITLWKFHSILLKYQETLDFGSSINEIVNLIDLAVLIFFFAHFMACSWYFVGNMSRNYSQKNWIDNYQLSNQPIPTLYCYSFYWATMTMVTVGYGDFTGQNVYEVLSSIVMMFGASVIFAYSLNSIGNILNNLNQSNYTYKKKLLLINSYMNQNNVSLELQNRVRNYLKFYLDEEKVGSQNEIQQILDTLSETLQQELLFDVQSKAIKQSKFLQMHFSQNTLRKISLNLTLKSYVPGEQIYKQDSNDQSLYIIQKGQVQLIDEPSGKLLRTYNGGESFGEYELLVGDNRKSTAISNSFAQIYLLQYLDLEKAIKENSEDFQTLSHLKDELKLQYPNKLLKCQACTGNHTIYQCSYLQYKPNLEVLVKREGFLFQKRQQGFRKLRSRFNSLYQLHFIQQEAIKLLEQVRLSLNSSRNLDEKYQTDISDNITIGGGQARKSIQCLMKDNYIEEVISQHSPKFQNVENIQFPYFHDEKNISSCLPKRHSVGFLPQTRVLLNTPLAPFNMNDLKIMSKQLIRIPSQEEGKFCQLDEYNCIQFHNCDIDQMREYNSYFPYNNASEVLKNIQKYKSFLMKMKKQIFSTKYQFYKFDFNQFKKNFKIFSTKKIKNNRALVTTNVI